MKINQPEKNRQPLFRFANGAGTFALILTAGVFLLLALISLLSTCRIDLHFSQSNNEHVSFLADPVLLNAAVLAGCFCLCLLIRRIKLSRAFVQGAALCMLLIQTALGLWWVLSAKALPYADSAQIIEEALRISEGSYESLAATSYFRLFPFQLGYLMYAEGFARIFGSSAALALSVFNVLWVDGAFLALLFLTKELFNDLYTEFFTALLLCLCLQPAFLCTFLYGVLPGLGLSLWGACFVLYYLRKRQFPYLLAAAILTGLAVALKKNYLIVAAADCIVLMLDLIRKKKLTSLIGAALLVSLSLLLPVWIQRTYEVRADAVFGEGTPQSAWLVTGFRESSMCSGWFGSYTTTVLSDNGFDQAATKAQIGRDLKEQADQFLSRPRYLASFMYHKLVSQWNEPAFQCVWSAAVSPRSGPVSPFIQSLFDGRAGDVLNGYFNYFQQFVYVFFAVGLLYLIREKRNMGDGVLLLPVTVLGAFLYHGLFEAKSQYALIYLPMMLPFAAYGIGRLGEWTERLLFGRKKG